MSNSLAKSVIPLVLEAGPSWRVRAVILAGIFLMLFAVTLLPLPIPLLVFAVLLLGATSAYSWRKHPALGGEPVTVRLDSDGRWQWQQGGESEAVELLGDSYHVPFLVILNFRPQGKRRPIRTLLITLDNTSPDSFRRLRVHLNWLERESVAR